LAWKTVRHLRTVFGTIMNDAEQRDLIDTNPVRKTRLPRRPLAVEKPAIVPEQIRVLLEAMPEPSRSIAWLLVFTGLRVGEILALRWSNVDLVNQFIRARQTVYEGHFDEPKTARSKRTVPLGPVAIGILRNRKPMDAMSTALVFATRQGAPLSRRN